MPSRFSTIEGTEELSISHAKAVFRAILRIVFESFVLLHFNHNARISSPNFNFIWISHEFVFQSLI